MIKQKTQMGERTNVVLRKANGSFYKEGNKGLLLKDSLQHRLIAAPVVSACNIRGLVVAVLQDAKSGEIKKVIESHNIVTDAGDIYYAQLGASEATTNAFGIFELGTAGTAPAKGDNRSAVSAFVSGSQKAIDGTYPKTNDTGDADNTGDAVDAVSYRVSYTTGEANSAGIDRGIITNVTPGASEPILCYFTLTSFTKTSSDTLKLFVNHTFTGV